MSTLNKQNIIPAGTVMNTTLNSSAVVLQKIYNFAIQVVWSGTPNGTFQLQASCDPFPLTNYTGYPTPSDWTTVAGSSQTANMANSSLFWNFSMCGFEYVRLVYNDASGGTSTAVLTVSSCNGK